MKTFSLESKILLGICSADCLITAISYSLGLIKEGNPIMRFFLNQGITPFILAKFGMSVIPISLLEILREKYPKEKEFIKISQRIAMVGYPAIMILPNISNIIGG